MGKGETGYLKGCLVGDAYVGKTCLLMTYSTNTFPTGDYHPTCYNEFTLNAQVGDMSVQLDIRDTAGQEDSKWIRPIAYRDTKVFLLAFSLVKRASYENIYNKWLPEVKLYAPDVPIILVGTKLDLRNDEKFLADHPEENFVTTEEGEELKEDIRAVAYIECSSKTQQNVTAVFDAVVALLPPPIQKKKKSERQDTCKCIIL